MTKLYAFAAAGLLFAGCVEQTDTSTSQAPILGGINTSKGQFPTVVAVELGNGSALCTGTLVAPDLILTAAHCVDPAELGVSTQAEVTSGLSVHLDATGVWGTGDPGVAYEAKDSAHDPLFTQPGSPDVGLVWLAVPVTDRDPSPINFDHALAPVGTEVTMVGFGIADNGGAGRENVLFNKGSTSCGFIGVDDGTFLCFSESDGKGTCSGDSGGPAFASINGKDTVVGVTSFGDQNCTQFGAHMRTDAAEAWIKQEAPELDCVSDGACAAACGQNGLPQDPDCPVCATDADCGTDQVCATGGRCEAAPFTPGGLGGECGSGFTDCEVGQCASGPDGMRCSESCSTASDCGDGFDCLGANGGTGGACWPSSGGGGCSTGGNGAGGGALLLVGAAMLIARRRR